MIQLSKTGLGFFLHQVTKEEIELQNVSNSRLDLATEGRISNQGATSAIPTVIKTSAVHKGCILVSKNVHETFREHLSSEEIELQCITQLRTRIWLEILEMLSAKFRMWNDLPLREPYRNSRTQSLWHPFSISSEVSILETDMVGFYSEL